MLLDAKRSFCGLNTDNKDLINYKTQLIANPCFCFFSHKSYTYRKILVVLEFRCVKYLICSACLICKYMFFNVYKAFFFYGCLKFTLSLATILAHYSFEIFPHWMVFEKRGVVITKKTWYELISSKNIISWAYKGSLFVIFSHNFLTFLQKKFTNRWLWVKKNFL